MAAVGGTPESVSIAGREFACTADNDINRKLGGFENEKQSNGDGTTRTIKTRVPWSLGGVTVEIDNDNDDQEFLEQVQRSSDDVDITVSYVDGSTYAGQGTIVGELVYTNQNAAASFDMSGPGELKKL
jgi:hypothetical protein